MSSYTDDDVVEPDAILDPGVDLAGMLGPLAGLLPPGFAQVLDGLVTGAAPQADPRLDVIAGELHELNAKVDVLVDAVAEVRQLAGQLAGMRDRLGPLGRKLLGDLTIATGE